MTYIRVRWIHEFPNDPVMLYSELDSERMETRKVELYDDGHCGYASTTECGGDTNLGELPIPDLSEIAEDSQFEPEEITQSEFEEIWKKRHGKV